MSSDVAGKDSPRRIKRLDLLGDTANALMHTLCHYYNVASWEDKTILPTQPYVILTSPDRIKDYVRVAGAVTYPFFTCKLTNMSAIKTFTNNYMTKRFGVNMGPTDGGRTVVGIMHYVPVAYTFTLEFISNKYSDITNFAAIWVEKAEDLRLSLTPLDDFPDFYLKCQSIQSDEVVFPDQVDNKEAGNYYILQFGCTVNSYSGYVEYVPTVGKFIIDQHAASLQEKPPVAGRNIDTHKGMQQRPFIVTGKGK